MSIGTELAKKAINDDYLASILGKLEIIVAKNLFNENVSTLKMKSIEISHLIRFADILSFSDNEKGRNLSYKIISLLFEYDCTISTLQEAFHAILIRLGNFPAVTYLESKQMNEIFELPFEKKIEEKVKRSIQEVPHSELTFTDSQYEIFELLKSNKHFSFSGPTSLGKSFIIESFIKHLILDEKIKDNIALLVPTRALINQNVQKLKEEFNLIQGYEILAHPKIPEYIRSRKNNYIFVFTPERLISYISDKGNPPIEYLFIDEAHKIISEKDTRTPLYYHAILLAQKKSIRLYFASPNLSNPEIYLKLFDRSTDESFHTNDSPVSQNKYLLNLDKQQIKVYGYFKSNNFELKQNLPLFEWIMHLSHGKNKSIIYCNSKTKTRDNALNFSEKLPYKQSDAINQLIELISETIHKDYYLINCLRKGVAFHFGDLPQRIRVKIEELFRIGELDYLFCTSTLLEGVNLPAKNIFVLDDKIGNSKFKKIDFLNLIGRAGRLTKEFSGNIFIVKNKSSNTWNDESLLEELTKTDQIPPASSQVLKGNKKFYENIFRALEDKPFTNKNTPNYTKEILNHYSNIALIHNIENTSSVLLNSLLKSTPESIGALNKNSLWNKVPTEILKVSSSIKLIYQNEIITEEKEKLLILPYEPHYEDIKKILSFLYSQYNWEEEEKGRKQILKNAKKEKHTNILNYYSVLMNSWMSSNPINVLISESINYLDERNIEIFDEYMHNMGRFDNTNQVHINIAINDLLSDIENVLRFRFVKYFNNYYLLLKEILGEDNAGANWAEFLEYGSTKKEIIELQNTGLPRHLASYLFNGFLKYLEYDSNGNLMNINRKGILTAVNRSEKDIDQELREFYRY